MVEDINSNMKKGKPNVCTATTALIYKKPKAIEKFTSEVTSYNWG